MGGFGGSRGSFTPSLPPERGRSPAPPDFPRFCFLGVLAQNESPGDFYFFFLFLGTHSRVETGGILGGVEPRLLPTCERDWDSQSREQGPHPWNAGDPREEEQHQEPGASRCVPTLGAAPPRGAGLWGPESPAQSLGRRGENPQKRVRSGKQRVNGCGSPRSGSHTPLPRAGLTHPGLGPAPRHPRAAPAAPSPARASAGESRGSRGDGGGSLRPPRAARPRGRPVPSGTGRQPQNAEATGKWGAPRGSRGGPGAAAAPASPRPLRYRPPGCRGGFWAEPAERDGEGMTSAHYSRLGSAPALFRAVTLQPREFGPKEAEFG